MLTSDPDGMCHIVINNLDGTTNLKVRKAPGTTGYLIQAHGSMESFLPSEEKHIDRTRFVCFTSGLNFSLSDDSVIISSAGNSPVV